MKDAADEGGTVSTVNREVVSEADKARMKHAENPFWEGLQMATYRRKAKLRGDNGPKALVTLGTGEREGVTEVSRIVEVDGDQFIKMFSRYLFVWFDISKNGQRLFEFALYEASRNKNKDALWLHPKDADKYHKGMGRSGYSQASFYRAADELCGAQILARAEVAWKFFINPGVFWNGDRVEFIAELRKAPQIIGPDEQDRHAIGGIEWPDPDFFSDGTVP